MQAIVTKYYGPTDKCGSYIKATCQARSLKVAWNYELNSEKNHYAAAMALARELEWFGAWAGGANPDGKGFTFVQLDGSVYVLNK